jgi:hypothetical protein
VRDFLKTREDSHSAAPGLSGAFHGAPTFGVARCFFCIEEYSTAAPLLGGLMSHECRERWRKGEADSTPLDCHGDRKLNPVRGTQ